MMLLFTECTHYTCLDSMFFINCAEPNKRSFCIQKLWTNIEFNPKKVNSSDHYKKVILSPRLIKASSGIASLVRINYTPLRHSNFKVARNNFYGMITYWKNFQQPLQKRVFMIYHVDDGLNLIIINPCSFCNANPLMTFKKLIHAYAKLLFADLT